MTPWPESMQLKMKDGDSTHPHGFQLPKYVVPSVIRMLITRCFDNAVCDYGLIALATQLALSEL